MPQKTLSERIKITEDAKGNVTISIEAQQSAISLCDENGNVLIQDKFGNEISMGKTGIRISSKKDLHLEAGQKIYIKGRRGIFEEVERGPLEISADEISITAKNEINIKAASKMILKGSKISGN